MSNTTLTADIIAKEAVMILENDCIMGGLVHRAYEEEFTNSVNGYTPGETISIKRPADFTVRTGATAAVQDVIEGKTSITVDQQIGVDFKFTSSDLTLQIKDLSERVIKPALVQLANKIDGDVLALYKKIPNHVTIPSGGINSFEDFALAAARMDLIGVPQDGGRSAVLTSTDSWALLGSQTALYMQDVAKQAYRTRKIGPIGDIDTYTSLNCKTHTCGSRTGTDAIAATFTGDTWASTKDTNTSAFNIGSMSGATVTLAIGDTFTIADCYDVNPVTKEKLPHLKMFVVQNLETASGSAVASCEVTPAAIPSGAHQTVAFATGTSDLNGKTVTYQGAASTGYAQNLYFHKNALALVMVPMVKPPGAVDVGRRSYKGYSVRVIPFYDGISDVSSWRLDLLYGVKAIDPRLAVRASLAADI